MKKMIGVAAFAGTAVAGVAVALPAAAVPKAPPANARPAWGTCTDPSLVKAGAECALLPVPLDYRRPSGQKIHLAISRIKHTSHHYQGVMLVNPGGPGASGLGLSRLGASVPDHAGDDYDWVGFDPRGVGSSKPSINCDTTYFAPPRPNFIPATTKLERTWLRRSRSYARACERTAAALLPHMKTTDSVNDMESIRRALGREQINFYGFSYGTYLGQAYSTLHPSRVRRMVLDSNVDPRKVWYQANLDQDIAFDRNIKIWFGWLAENDRTFHLGTTGRAVERAWYAQRRALGKRPAGGTIGPDEWTDIFLQAGYYVYGWAELGKAFSGWVNKHDATRLRELYADNTTPQNENGFAVYNAVQCTDVRWPRSWRKWKRDNWRAHRRAPFLAWDNAWFNAPCLFWAAGAGRPVPVSGRRVRGALLIGEALDAATPFAGNLEVRRRYPKASLIAAPGGTTHAGSLSGVTCVDSKIADYLATGRLPRRRPGNRPDATCPAVPRPPASGKKTASYAQRADRPVPLLRHP